MSINIVAKGHSDREVGKEELEAVKAKLNDSVWSMEVSRYPERGL